MGQKGFLVSAAALVMLASGGASAQGYSLLGEGGSFARRPPFFGPAAEDAEARPLILARAEIADTAEAEAERDRAYSLFVGRASYGFFAPPSRETLGTVRGQGSPGAARGDRQAELIRDLIAEAEAGPAGYDAVQHGATRRPDRAPTRMTLGEIFAWIDDTPGQPHAIGRYQFIPSTLARLVTVHGAGPDDAFSPQMQDRLADILLHEAGLGAYRAGAISRVDFMNNLARIWAGFPNSSGRSHYHGFAGNAATMSRARFDREMAAIFADPEGSPPEFSVAADDPKATGPADAMRGLPVRRARAMR